MDIRRTRTCQKCQVQVSLDKVRLYPLTQEKNLLVCEECCEKLKNFDKSKKIKQKIITNKEPIKNIYQPKSFLNTSSTRSSNENKQCVRCKYNFKPKERGYDQLVCPYCGKSDKII